MSGKTSIPTALQKRRRLEVNLDDHIHLACLTNKQLIIELLVSAKKALGKQAHKWLLSDVGQRSFLRIGNRASCGEILPSGWVSAFAKCHLKNEADVQKDHNDQVPPSTKCAHLGELIALATNRLSPSSHRERLSHVLKLIVLPSPTPLDIRKTVALLDASTESECEDMQDQAYSLLKENHPKRGSILDMLVSVQVPVLQKMTTHSIHKYVLSETEELDRCLSRLFMKQHEDENMEREPEEKDFISSSPDTLKVRRFVEAADLARRGDQLGSKHGCVICVSRDVILSNTELTGKVGDMTNFESSQPISTSSYYDVVIGRGWNHNAFENSCKRGFGRKRMIHAEVHAVADVIRSFGEALALENLFPQSVVMIVELHKNTTYDDAPPCPKCEQLLRGVGVRRACHSTDKGAIDSIQLAPPNPEFLSRDVVTVPFKVACQEVGAECTFIQKECNEDKKTD